MPRSPDQEYVTIPEYHLLCICDDPIQRLNALTVGTVEDYLTLCSERLLTFESMRRRGQQIYQDIGRFQGFPDVATRGRKSDLIMEALQDLDHRVHLTVSRAHGLRFQTVRYVRMIGDGILFQLTTLPIQRSLFP